MIASPLGLRLDPNRPVREQILEAVALGARGVVLDAIGDLAPQRLSDTGRRELRHVLRSSELELVALSLPTRRPFDTTDQLDDRLRRAEAAFGLAYELGASRVLARVGGLPAESEADARGVFVGAVRELGRRADHRGVRLAVETGPDSGAVVRALLDQLDSPGLAASVDPASLQQHGHDPAAAARALGPWVVHAYAPGASTTLVRLAGRPDPPIDWEEYLGALEESNYRGFLTVWPDTSRPAAAQFAAVRDRVKTF
jgi:sugar phosphate isomerase/epimerase